MRSKESITLVMVMILMNSTLNAGVVPGRWEKVAAENLGSKFIVTMQSGERIDGFFKGLTEVNLNLAMLDGRERAVRKSEVIKVITAEKRMDSLTNGFVIGMAVGAGIPLIAAASTHESGAWVAVATIVYGLIGGAVGVGIDAVVKGHITLYEAPKAKSHAQP
jgi:hypothetical protein